MARHMTFHVGEFARMTGVNKRTLHYYDSEGIFSPDSVEPNGYRAYSSRQFYPFYMIRMFRDMGLDLSEIKEYMQGRTPEKFARLLAEQEEWLEQEMAKLKRMRHRKYGSMKWQNKSWLIAGWWFRKICVSFACGRIGKAWSGSLPRTCAM